MSPDFWSLVFYTVSIQLSAYVLRTRVREQLSVYGLRLKAKG
ncbi:hypothetical protein [Moorena sp. SIO3I6]|nr:hypothetical protein [Moorena sp. SIO3I6]